MTTQQILQGVHDWTNGKIVYDISAAHPDGQGNPTLYVDLAAALGNGGANIPEPLRKGGMSVKFIKGSAQSSDNKYVQARLMAESFTTDVAQWQGIDEEPKAFSKNFVESGGVKEAVSVEKRESLSFSGSNRLSSSYIGGNGAINSANSYRVYYFPCVKGNKFNITIEGISGSSAKLYAVYSSEPGNFSAATALTVSSANLSNSGSYTVDIIYDDAKYIAIGYISTLPSITASKTTFIPIQDELEDVKADVSEMKKLSGIYDISVNKAVGGTPTSYANLTAALGTDGENIQEDFRKGGMGVRFIDSNTNKYVQYRLTSKDFTTNVTYWQGISGEVSIGDKNLITSDAVKKAISEPITRQLSFSFNPDNISNKYITNTGNLSDADTFRVYYFPCERGDKFRLVVPGMYGSSARSYAVYSSEPNEFSSATCIEVCPNTFAVAETYDIDIIDSSAKYLAVQYNSQVTVELYKTTYADKSYMSMLKNKSWTINGNIQYDSNQIPKSYDIKWSDGTSGTVVLSNFNGNAFEYTTITATYDTVTIVYTQTFDINGYITNETFNIQ